MVVIALGGGVIYGVLFRGEPPIPARLSTFSPQPKIIDRTDNVVLLDIGATWFGNVALQAPPDNVGNEITVRLGERLTDRNRIDVAPPGTVRVFQTSLPLSATPTALPLTKADARGLPDGAAAMPFRYIEIEGWKGDLRPQNVTVTAYISARYQPRGNIEFLGDSPAAKDLNRLVALGNHTVAATSFMDLFVDGDRERLPYQADAYISQLNWYAVTGDTGLARRTFQQLLNAPTWPSEWMSLFIFLAYEDYRTTGDVEYLRRIYKRLPIFTLFDFIDDTGLVSTANKALAKKFVEKTKADYLEDIVDWPRGERDGYEMTAHNTVVNAFVYRAFRRMAEMAEVLQFEADRAKYTAAADRLQQTMERLLVDTGAGVFVDGLETKHVSAHALFIPLAFGLVPNHRRPATIEALKARIAEYGGGFPCSVYTAQYLLDALFENGEGPSALALIRNTTERGWLNMLDRYNATITHEAWDLKFKENEDWNHAWGAPFLNVLQRHVVGVNIRKPAWTSWTISPDSSVGIPIVATVATPAGNVGVRINPTTKTVTLQGGSALDSFAKSEAGDWSYNLIRSANESN